jgi:hypothetical protein
MHDYVNKAAGRVASSAMRASPFAAHVRRCSEAGVKVIDMVLQIGAPKCAVCWTTYGGLVNAGWFAATRLNPVWFTSSILISMLILAIMFRKALRARAYGTVLCAAAAWLLLMAGWFMDFPLVRYAGLTLLLISFASEKLALPIPRSRASARAG